MIKTDIFEYIYSLPSDLINYIQNYINLKEIIARERINKIKVKQEQLMIRLRDEWKYVLNNKPYIYNVSDYISITCKNKNLLNFYKLDKLKLDFKLDLSKIIVNNAVTYPNHLFFAINLYSIPPPQYCGQIYKAINEMYYITCYTKFIGNNSLFKAISNAKLYYRKDLKYCCKYTLEWVGPYKNIDVIPHNFKLKIGTFYKRKRNKIL